MEILNTPNDRHRNDTGEIRFYVDGQLIHLAKEDGNGLTKETLGLLKKEFVSRSMDIKNYLPVAE